MLLLSLPLKSTLTAMISIYFHCTAFVFYKRNSFRLWVNHDSVHFRDECSSIAFRHRLVRAIMCFCNNHCCRWVSRSALITALKIFKPLQKMKDIQVTGFSLTALLLHSQNNEKIVIFDRFICIKKKPCFQMSIKKKKVFFLSRYLWLLIESIFSHSIYENIIVWGLLGLSL